MRKLKFFSINNMKKILSFSIVLFASLLFFSESVTAQCNRPLASDNPCTAPTFCNTAQMNAYCSTVPFPVMGRTFLFPNDFCGSLESPSWFKFVAQTPTLDLRITATGCGIDGIQGVIYSTTNCSDSATYTRMSNCTNPNGGSAIVTVSAAGLVAGETYYILIDGYQGAGCAYEFDILNSGQIQTVNSTLPAPTDIFGPTSVCANATNVTFSVPRIANATDFQFNITQNGSTIFNGLRSDSFYTVASFPAAGTAQVCVTYSNECALGVPLCSNITIGANSEITLPSVFLCPGQEYTMPDGILIDNNLPPNTDDTQDYTAFVPGAGGCDTTFTVSITKYARRLGTRTVFLKPSESYSVCSNSYSPTTCAPTSRQIVCGGASVNGCDSTVLLNIINTQQNYVPSPSLNVNLTCSTQVLRVTAQDSCAGVVHYEKWTWYYQTTAASPSTFLSQTVDGTLNVSSAGIYRLIIRDSVMRVGAPTLGYKIYIDTIVFTVTGSGSSTRPPQPGLINGTLGQSLCQGNLDTFRIAAVPDATDYVWTIVNNGGTIVSGQGTTEIVVSWNTNTTSDTIRVLPRNACLSATEGRDLLVVINSFPNLNAGRDTTLCSLSYQLNAVSSTGSGTWSSPSNVVNFAQSTSRTTTATATSSGTYQLIWTESANGCTKRDTVSITFNAPPQYAALVDSCNGTRNQSFIKFTIGQGRAPFNVYQGGTATSAGAVTGNTFVSNAFTPGVYNLDIVDANNCRINVSGTAQTCFDCSTTAAGQMNLTELFVCQGDSARAIYNNATQRNDGNDTLEFVLHTGNVRSGILQRSSRPVFGFRAGMQYDVRYFISAIVGNDSSGHVQLGDLCFSASTGVPVTFRRNPTASFTPSSTNICIGTCASLTLNLTGAPRYNLTMRIIEATTYDTLLTGVSNGSEFIFCPTQNTTISLVSVVDSNGCSTALTQQQVFTTSVAPYAGIAEPPIFLCAETDSTIILRDLLTDEDAGGRWLNVSTSTVPTGAFNATTGRFITRTVPAGAYRFAYAVTAASGSTCPNDTAFVDINIKVKPNADAGANDTITCRDPQVLIGGTTTTNTAETILSWSAGTSRNTATQNVSVPGSYLLTVTLNGCIDTDRVEIAIDTIHPVINIAAITDTITCRLDSVVLNASASTPNTGVNSAWSYDGTIFDFDAISAAYEGGKYYFGAEIIRNGCAAIDSVEVAENTAVPTVSIAPPSVVNCRDTLVIVNAANSSSSASGTRYPLQWEVSNGGNIVTGANTLEPVVNRAGRYLLRITDSLNGCIDSAFVNVSIDTIRPLAFATAIDTLDCTTLSIPLSGRGSTLASTVTYNWVGRPGNIVSGATTLQPVVNTAGNYVLTVTNTRNGCTDSDSVTVASDTRKPTAAFATISNPACFGECNGRITVDSVSGGRAPFAYSLDGKVFTTRNNFANVCAGNYTLYVKDAGGCVIDSAISLAQGVQGIASLGADTTLRMGDSLLLRLQTNIDSLRSITWNPYTSPLCQKDSLCNQQWVKPVKETIYQVTVIGKSGCRTSAKVRISVDKERPIFVPNIFTPNNDGQNDRIYPFGSQIVKTIHKFQIYDRWGEKVFEETNFNTDDPTKGWDGIYQGREAAVGVYLFWLEVEYLNGDIEIIKGDITLMR